MLLFRPLLIIIPSLLPLSFLAATNMLPVQPALLARWLNATIAIAWMSGLNAEEPRVVKNGFFQLMYLPLRRT